MTLPDRHIEDIQVSIVIPVYNQLHYTKQCLDALPLTYNGIKVEVIVVDNASNDGTDEYLRSLGGRIRPVFNSKNLGFGGGCNAGACAAIGKYLVFLNNDTVPRQKWIEPAIAHFKDPSVGIVGSKLLYPDGSIQHGGIQFSKIPDFPLDFPLHRFRGEKADLPEANRVEEVHAVTAACLFIPRKLFTWLKGFPEEYGMYFEDIDLNMQVRALGRKIIYEPASVVVHYESKSSSAMQGQDLLTKAAGIFYQKWGNRISSLLNPPLSIA